jgi:hypothetical protein
MTDENIITGKYCNSTDIVALFGDISDEIDDDLFTTVLGNTEAWIEANLKRHYVPIPTSIPQALKTVAIYHGASDIILSLYHGEELPVQYDVWFQKAQDLLDAYIDEYLNSEATAEEQAQIQMVKHSHSRTYNAKRLDRWAR